jgi:prepilin peptidase CpaA
MLPFITQAGLLGLVGTAAVYDYRFRRIPNWLVLAGILAGIALNTFLFGWPGCLTALQGFGIGFGVYFVLYLLRGMGAGDVKLMGAVGAFVGPKGWLLIFFFTAIIGGVLAMILLASRGRVRNALWNVAFILSEVVRLRAPYASREDLSVHSPKALKLPHGVSIALGCVAFLVLAAVKN